MLKLSGSRRQRNERIHPREGDLSRTRKKPGHWLRRSADGVVALLLVPPIGFAVFVAWIGLNASTSTDHADAAVVLTGDPSRIQPALDLLASRHVRRVLITGVDNADEIERLRPVYALEMHCCVEVDARALTTAENARDTVRWVAAHGIATMIVVTSDFHVPRALLQLGRALPGVTLRAHPVVSGITDLARWPEDRRALRLLMREYAKFVAVLLGA